MLSEISQEGISANAAPDAAEPGASEAPDSPPMKTKNSKKAKHAAEADEAAQPAAKAAAETDPKVLKLKRMCQQAGIPIGPSIYKQPDRRAAFAELLQKHGLTAKSCARSPLPNPRRCAAVLGLYTSQHTCVCLMRLSSLMLHDTCTVRMQRLTRSRR